MRPGGIRELDGGGGDSSLTCGEVFGFTDGSRNYIEVDCMPLIGPRWMTEGVGPWQLAARVDDSIIIPANTLSVPGNFLIEVFGSPGYGADGAVVTGAFQTHSQPRVDAPGTLSFGTIDGDQAIGSGFGSPFVPLNSTLRSLTVTCPAFPGLDPGDSTLEIQLQGIPLTLASWDPAVGVTDVNFTNPYSLAGGALQGREIVLVLRIRPTGLYPYAVPALEYFINWNIQLDDQRITDVCDIGGWELGPEEAGVFSLDFRGIPLDTTAPESSSSRKQGTYHYNLGLWRTGPGGNEFWKSFPARYSSLVQSGVRGISYTHTGVSPSNNWIRVTRLDGENFNPSARLRVWID